MFIASIEANEEWKDLEAEIAKAVPGFQFQNDTTYFIQIDARGGVLRLAEVAEADADKLTTADGQVLRAGPTAEYIKASGLKVYTRKDEPTDAELRILIAKKEA